MNKDTENQIHFSKNGQVGLREGHIYFWGRTFQAEEIVYGEHA